MADKRLKILSTNIRAERVRKQLSQIALAEKINISENSMGKIERAQQTPSALIIYDIAKALNISIDELYKGL